MLESKPYTGAVYGGECWEQIKIILVATQPLDRGNLRTASSLRHGGHRDDDAHRPHFVRGVPREKSREAQAHSLRCELEARVLPSQLGERRQRFEPPVEVGAPPLLRRGPACLLLRGRGPLRDLHRVRHGAVLLLLCGPTPSRRRAGRATGGRAPPPRPRAPPSTRRRSRWRTARSCSAAGGATTP